MKPKSASPRQLAQNTTGSELSPFSPARQHAEEFYRLGRAAGQHAILCGLALIPLYEVYGVSPQGGRPKKTTTACGGFNDCKTWPELVKREVGISDETARRWMAAARAQLPAIAGQVADDPDALIDADESIVIEVISEAEPARLVEAVQKLSNGKTLEQLLLPLDASGQFDPSKLVGKARDAWEKIVALCDPYDDDHLGPKFFDGEAYDAMHEDALKIRPRVEAGEIAPTRAWAGLCGRAAADGQGGRAATNHVRNIGTALTKLNHSFGHWDELPSESRSEIEAAWQDLWNQVPSTIKSSVKKLEGWK